VAIPNDAVRVNPEAGTAEVHVRNLHIDDYHTLPNGLIDGPNDPATVSIDGKWGGPVTRRVSVDNTSLGFAGTFAEEHASVTWSGRNDATGFHFTANRGNFATTAALGGAPFAEVGFERNGIFFRPDDSDGQEGPDGDAALVRALAVPPAAATLPDLTLPRQPQSAGPPAATAVGTDRRDQQPPTAGPPAAQAVPTGALDQVFADPVGAPFVGPLRTFA
jgi:hypothetical protein